MDPKYTSMLQDFAAISLNQLNAQASLMSRIESKFFIHESALWALLKDLKKDFYILEIGGNKVFSYDNVYMDTKELDFYHAHNNGDSDRIKMRTRYYIESWLSYFEFKNKRNSVMRKFRYDIDLKKHGQMDLVAYDFVNDVYSSLYGKEFSKIVFPSLKTKYQRCTLCHKETAEKITIDMNVAFEQVRYGDESFSPKNLVIVEFKTERIGSPTQNIFEKHGMIELGACSKYCLGNYFLRNVKKRDRFNDTIAKAKQIMYSTGPTIKEEKTSIKQLKKFEITNKSPKVSDVSQ